MKRFRHGKPDVLRIVPDAKCMAVKGGWQVMSLEVEFDSFGSFASPRDAWEDAYETLHLRGLTTIRSAA